MIRLTLKQGDIGVLLADKINNIRYKLVCNMYIHRKLYYCVIHQWGQSMWLSISREKYYDVGELGGYFSDFTLW